MVKKKFKIRTIYVMTSLIMSLILKKKAKNCKNWGFLKITIVAVSEEIFLIFFHYLEVNSTYKLKILW